METNVGRLDRQVRIAVGALAGAASLGMLGGVIGGGGVTALVLGVVAIAMLGTAATSQCGMYAVLGIDTCSAETR